MTNPYTYELSQTSQEEIEKVMKDFSTFYNNSSGKSRVIKMYEILYYFYYNVLRKDGRFHGYFDVEFLGLIQFLAEQNVFCYYEPLTSTGNEQVQDDTTPQLSTQPVSNSGEQVPDQIQEVAIPQSSIVDQVSTTLGNPLDKLKRKKEP